MSHVTFETAARLKEAGFPQPKKFTVGEFWFMRVTPKLEYEEILVVHTFRAELERQLPGITSERWAPDPDDVFAPTATDLLRQLPDYWFVAVSTTDPHGLYQTCIDPEELAAAWLTIH